MFYGATNFNNGQSAEMTTNRMNWSVTQFNKIPNCFSVNSNLTYSGQTYNSPFNGDGYSPSTSYYIEIKQNNNIIFVGSFTTNGLNIITNFYENSNPNKNLVVYDFDYGADYIFSNGTFTNGGTILSNIPSLNLIYNANRWSIWSSGVSYLKNGMWTDIADGSITFNIIPLAISNVCFPINTHIQTDQGLIPIQKIDTTKNTIRNKKIIAITKTITTDKHLICFEKDSILNDVPNKKTFISKNHLIFYGGKMIKAKEFVYLFNNVYKVKYNGECLYNVLLEKHDKMIVNNLICETLHPENSIAKLFELTKNLNIEDIELSVKLYNKTNKDAYKKEKPNL